MPANSVEQKPSNTAMFAALRRAIAHREFNHEKFGPDYLAENFLPPLARLLIRSNVIRKRVKKKLNRYLPGNK